MSSTAKRTLVIWVALILMFVSVYSMFVDANSDAQRAAPPPPASSSSPLSYIPLLGVPVFFGLMWINGRRAQRCNADLAEGLVALNQRRLDDAVRSLAATARKYRQNLWAGPIAHYHLATAHTQRGELDVAEDLLTRVERWAKLAYGTEARLLAAIGLAQVYGLRGDVDAARRWLDEAKRRHRRAGNAVLFRPLVTWTEVVVLVREERHHDALGLIDSARVELDSTIACAQMRELWLVEAFAVWRMSDPRGAATPEALVRRALPAAPGEHAALVARWPDLRAFLETHGIPAGAFARRDAVSA
jgi:tetratricopeptide (TPR) repeat protein